MDVRGKVSSKREGKLETTNEQVKSQEGNQEQAALRKRPAASPVRAFCDDGIRCREPYVSQLRQPLWLQALRSFDTSKLGQPPFAATTASSDILLHTIIMVYPQIWLGLSSLSNGEATLKRGFYQSTYWAPHLLSKRPAEIIPSPHQAAFGYPLGSP